MRFENLCCDCGFGQIEIMESAEIYVTDFIFVIENLLFHGSEIWVHDEMEKSIFRFEKKLLMISIVYYVYLVVISYF